MKNEVTITREEFHDTISKIMCEVMSNPFDVIKLSIVSAKAEIAFFGDEEDDEPEQSEARFKVGDKVFVIDNKGDDNLFVHQVVTVMKVNGDDTCIVTNGNKTLWVYFNNLRKVETP